MTQSDPPPPLPDLDAMLEITEQFEAARADDPAMKAAEPEDLIRHVPGKRAIFEGQFNGRDVVFRMSLTDENDAIEREWKELERLWPYMCEDPFRICEPIHVNLKHRIMVLERIKGRPLLKQYWQTPVEQRDRFFEPVSQWYRQSTTMSEGWRVVSTAGWIRRATRAAEKQPFENLQKYETQILQEMQRIGGLIENSQWRTAICHGDMHPNNLIEGDGCLTGIDIGGSMRMPIYKDMARFLVHMARRRLLPSGRTYLGVDLKGIEAFHLAFDMTKQERELTLPFFIAFEALIRVEILDLPPSRIKRAEEMYKDMLPGLKKVGQGEL